MGAIRGTDYERHANSKTLIVFVHGWTRTAADWAQARYQTRAKRRSADHLVPHIAAGAFATRGLGGVAQELLELIDQAVRDHAGYQEIILVGHSCGAVLVREIWVRAHGARPDGGISDPLAWADKVRRIVLLAAVNRGYNPAAPASLKVHLLYWVSDLIEIALGPRLMIHDLRRGSAFMTSLRLKWLAVANSLSEDRSPIVVQILGTVDDIVAPGDNIDLATGAKFFYLEAMGANHVGILDFAGDRAGERAQQFNHAINDSASKLRERSMSAAQIMDLHSDARDDLDVEESSGVDPALGLRPHPQVQQVVFVVHGIRDYGYWTKKLAARIKEEARGAGLTCRSVTSTYGYFPMGPFLLPAYRRKRVEWLMDQYVTARALYPKAGFQFVGHSNGTWIFAGALNACPAVKFERAVLAGSVLPSGFGWREIFASGQLRGLVNYVATNDIVVASVPRFLQWLRVLGLGSAGHDGFNFSAPADPGSTQPFTQICYVIGQHSAALNARHWNDIARYVIRGTGLPSRSEGDVQSKISQWAWVGAPAAAVILIGPFALLLFLLGLPDLVSFIGGRRTVSEVLGKGGATDWNDARVALAPVWALGLLAWAWLVNRILTKL